MTSLNELQERAGIRFIDEGLLLRALTHRSYVNEHPEESLDNERLEFLGDAVLAFIIASMLYKHYPEMQEGALTRLRASLVRTEQLAAFAQNFEVGNVIRLGRGELKGGGANRVALLCDTFEAIVGALYLDQGIDEVRRFVENLCLPIAEEIYKEQATIDAKSHLQEWAQEQWGQTPYYVTIDTIGPDHEKIFTVEVRIGDRICGAGKGSNKQSAAQEAARDALQNLGAL